MLTSCTEDDLNILNQPVTDSVLSCEDYVRRVKALLQALTRYGVN